MSPVRTMRYRSVHRSRGFNLIEAMVAVVIISVGLLGIAKMQALALASTGSAKMRSLAALEAASLAAALRADRQYWSNITAATTVTFQDGAVKTSSDGTLLSAAVCETAGACTTTTDMVAYNLRKWDADLATQMPRHLATLTCTAGAATAPVSCTVQLNWAENRVALDSQVDSTKTTLTNSYTLYVEP
jgi:type IV pilus assembly protein PilV